MDKLEINQVANFDGGRAQNSDGGAHAPWPALATPLLSKEFYSHYSSPPSCMNGPGCMTGDANCSTRMNYCRGLG